MILWIKDYTKLLYLILIVSQMVNPLLIRQLLRELEAEHGCPVQLRADTPVSVKWAEGERIGGRKYFGRFESRAVTVTIVKDLRDKNRDVEQFAGSYTSLNVLYNRIENFNRQWRESNPTEYDDKYLASAEGIFADPVPAGWGTSYETKVADITIKLIE